MSGRAACIMEFQVELGCSSTQIKEQMLGPDLHVFTLKFLALKKWFSPIKDTFQTFFDFCSPLFYALFSADPNIFSKKNLN